MTPNSPGSPGRYALLYDGSCDVCTTSVAWVRRWDSAGLIDCVPSNDPSARQRLPGVSREALDEAIHLVSPEGRVWRGAPAIEELLRILPRGERVAWLFRLPFAGPAADRIYRAFARNRHRFQCGPHCSK